MPPREWIFQTQATRMQGKCQGVGVRDRVLVRDAPLGIFGLCEHQKPTKNGQIPSALFPLSCGLQRGEDCLAGGALGGGDLAQDGVKRAESERLVIGHRDAVMFGRLRLQNDVLPTWLTLL